tara:strand:+ start:750 stop:1040 length:291 start_codon:yes stop_codon:yes gene_type:complete
MTVITDRVNNNTDEEKIEIISAPIIKKKNKKNKKIKVVLPIQFDAHLDEKVLYVKKRLINLSGSKTNKDKKAYKKYKAQLLLFETIYTSDIGMMTF